MSGAPVPVPVLELRGVRFRWPGTSHDVLQVQSLTIVAGERLLLQGPSGSGKSTLLSLAAGVLLPQAGEVRVLGQDWRPLRAARRDRRRADHIGYIFQQFNLLPYLSVLDNVLLPCRLSARRAKQTGESGQDAAARRLLQALGLPEDAWRRPAAALSVGQQQRVAAARALIGRPQLVIADEPTSALDEAHRDTFMALLLRECAAAGAAMLFVSHDQRLARHFTRVLSLSDVSTATPRQGEEAPA